MTSTLLLEAERNVYLATQTFRSLRAISFLLEQSEGSGPFDWDGEPIQDLAALLKLIADQGIEQTDTALEQMTTPEKLSA